MRFSCIPIWLLLPGLMAVAQEIRPYDTEAQAKHAQAKGYDPAYRVNYFENIILKAALTSSVGRLHFMSGRTGAVLDLSPVAEKQVRYSFDYKWVSVGFACTPGLLLNTHDMDELDESQAIAFDINYFYSDQWRQELS